MHLLVRSVAEIDVLLLRIRESDVPHRPVTPGSFRDDRSLDEGAVVLEYLNPIVHTVADI
jgi:hypothetical protein